MRIAAIVLAAGESRRMGQPKMLLPFGAGTILETVIETLAAVPAVERTVVVAGRQATAIRPVVERRGALLCVNPAPERGMTTSAQAGIVAAGEGWDAYLIALGDQPQLDAATLRAFLESAARSNRGLLMPSYRGRRGHPLLMKARYRGEIMALPESEGLNSLRARHLDDSEEISVDSAEVLYDIDTAEDYAAALSRRLDADEPNGQDMLRERRGPCVVTMEAERPDAPDAANLIGELDFDLRSFDYPEQSCHAFSIDKLIREEVAFYVLRVNGEAAACCGMKLYGKEYGEVKRMYVRPAFRRRGLAEAMLARLEERARALGIPALRLETGIFQVAAIGLYERYGFRRSGPFGEYREDPFSVYMEKLVDLKQS